MNIRTHTFKAFLLIGATLLANQVSAGCISIYQPPVLDQNFKTLSLQFNIHVTNKWSGLNNSSPIDQSFSEEVIINRSYQQSSDFCNYTTTIATPSDLSTATAYTTDVSNHVGRDYSLYPSASAALTNTDTGYVTYQSPFGGYSVPTYSSQFSITANANLPVWSDSLNQYLTADYSRGISLFEWGLEGYWQQLDLKSYLQSHIGYSNFSYSDLVNISNSNYQAVDKYGYVGTATLTSVTEVPLPGSYLMLLSGLGIIGVLLRHRPLA